MSIGQRGSGNQASGDEQIPGGGNVVAGFIPEIRQLQQINVGQEQRGVCDNEYFPLNPTRVSTNAAQ